MPLYELLLLGEHGRVEAVLSKTLGRMAAEYGLQEGELAIRRAADAGARSSRAATVAAFVGGAPDADAQLLADLLREGVPVLPTIGPGQSFGTDIPEALRPVNGLKRRADDPDQVRLATAMLECLGLLHRQRRAFVSYPADNERFRNLVETPAQEGGLAPSLALMRERMLGDTRFDAAVFIGGMHGILDEYAIFRRLQPDAAAVPLASTGGASLTLGARIAADDAELHTSLNFVPLLHQRLGVPVSERRYPTPDEQPDNLAARLEALPRR